MSSIENFKTTVINKFENITGEKLDDKYQTKDNYYGHLINYLVETNNLNYVELHNECRKHYYLDNIIIADKIYWPEVLSNFIINTLYSKGSK